MYPGSHRSTGGLLVESEFVPDGIREYCKCAHPGPDIRTRRENTAPSGLNTLQSVCNDIDHDVGPRVFVRGSIALRYPSPAHATSIVEGQFAIPTFPNLPAENTAVEVGGGFGRVRRYFQITDLAVGHFVSNSGHLGAPPNGSRLSCSALVKDQIPPACAVSFQSLLGCRVNGARLCSTSNQENDCCRGSAQRANPH